jgi:RimJ/RimL family protein N-acetyltransferase
MTIDLSLRPVTDEDVETFFVHRKATYPSGDLADHAAFIARWRNILDNSNGSIRTIVVSGQVVGYLAHFKRKDLPEVSYELGPQYWGRGYATKALQQFLKELTIRPLYARVFKNNAPSIRVLEKCGFRVQAEDRTFVEWQGREVEEFVFALDKR